MTDEKKFASSSQVKENGCGILRKVVFGLIVAASRLEFGFVVGWPTVLPKLQADNTTSLYISDSDLQWMVSIPGITGLVCTLLTGLFMEFAGPQKVLLLILLPAGIPFLMQAITPYKSLFYLGRVLTCIVRSVLGPLPSVLIAELSEPRFRGFLLSTEAVFLALGQMFIYVMAHFLPWDIATAVCALPVTLVAFLTFFVPESPYWLVRHDKEKAALKSLEKLRGSKDVKNELMEITHSIQDRPQGTMKDQMKQLAEPQHYRPIILLMAIFGIREFGGQYLIYAYAVFLFRKAGVSLDEFKCTILVGLVRLVCTMVATVILDRVGRRPLIISTTLVCGLAQVVGAVFLMVDLPGSSWVPLAAVLVFVASGGIGIGPVSWALVGELIPTPIRSVGSSIVNFGFTLSQILISFIFPSLMTISLGVAFLSFAFAHAILFVVLYFFMPETRCRSLCDLENTFKHARQKR